MKKSAGVDKVFLLITIVLLVGGFFIFYSASLGLLARGGSQFNAVTFNQVILGLLGGSIAAYIASRIPYTFWKKYSFYFFLISVVMMILVFIPHIGLFHGGARRWISIGSFSLQPAEIYKIGFVMYLATWLAGVKNKISTFKWGTLPFLVLASATAVLVLLQPDTDTFLVIILAGVGMLITAGGRWRDMAIMVLIGAVALTGLVFARPYLMQRVQTFMNPAADPTGSGYQIQQSLIAIGSGGIFGRGFGQSIQKFNFLPEPIGDSIFAVASEEFGLLGSVSIILLYLAFAFRGFRIATRAPDTFSALMVVGIIILIISQSFFNIAAMLAITPLSGTPLLFISHGGTAMFFALASVGIILNISRYQLKKPRD